MPTSNLKHVMIAGLAFYGNDSQVLRGIFSHMAGRTDWILHDARHNREKFNDVLEECQLDGIITHVANDDYVNQLQALKIPVINISGTECGRNAFPTVEVNNAAVGRMAAEYFLNRGYRHFAVEPGSDIGLAFMNDSARAFCSVLQERGFPYHVFLYYQNVQPIGWQDVRPPIVLDTLADIPKPAAVFACMDRLGEDICQMARVSGIAVPDQVAVLGADNFDFLCEMCYPPLSSVKLPGVQIGKTAAHLLELLMAGKPIPRKHWLIPPSGVVTRRSSEAYAMSNPALSKALIAIHGTSSRACSVPEIVRESGVNRRQLERLFRNTLGRSILHEMHSAMINRAVQILIETNAPIKEVAQRAGFRSLDHMDLVFRKRLGTTPRQVRRQTGYVAPPATGTTP
jgi:LacI family transcriptional regulator